ncbi:MAG: CoA protein activase [Desulfovibrionaceae bacterium]|nr:CoA protein activase [Desulfovibrionaceae bacterium]MBF0512530.1 CoA protein activase [Desulfovibrionaceae bacterium]
MAHVAGCDSGSVGLKLAVFDPAGNIVKTVYRRHKGRPLAVAREVLSLALSEFPGLVLAATGSTGRLIASAMGAPRVNELMALALATRALYPHVRSILEMGGEDSKCIVLDERGAILDFAINSACAAGTGSFLDQQSARMLLSIEQFASAAALSTSPARIAGRCSVFAKSDMIHLQQIATKVEDIAAGLCFAAAKNFKGAIVRGRELPPRVAFMGGVAQNAGMVRAFKETFELPELIVPEHAAVMGAIGAGLYARQNRAAAPVNLAALEAAVSSAGKSDERSREPLLAPGLEGENFKTRHLGGVRGGHAARSQSGGKQPVYLGIDVGSISTNLAVIDEGGELLASRYLRTNSRPIEAVKQGLAEIGELIADTVEVLGVGTTGSGRYMTADFFGADVVKNEITAQATAAVAIDPEVDTVFEIGGQDSKYISLANGVIVDFEMNKACAAGTGSFLEEQAEKLDVHIKDEFAAKAFDATAPCALGERCTVFMENSLLSALAKGNKKRDLLAGLAYSIVENYINRVVAGRKIGKRIFFQGGTAFNKAVVAAFERYLGAPIVVPPHHDVTGAIGMALIARDHARTRNPVRSGAQALAPPSVEPAAAPSSRSRFKGFDMARVRYLVTSFACSSCANRCEINKVAIEGEENPLLYGGRCEKYELGKTGNDLPDLFAFRENALLAEHRARKRALAASGRRAKRGAIGLPHVFFLHDQLPYFATLLWELGFEVVRSGPTNQKTVDTGSKALMTEACFPVKAALGHAGLLAEKGLPLFIPSFVNVRPAGDLYATGVCCPLTQAFPYKARQAFPGAEIFAPVVDFTLGPGRLARQIRTSLAGFRLPLSEIRRAMSVAERAQAAFASAIAAKGREVLEQIKDAPGPALVILGRPYNAFDAGMNLGIPKLLARLSTLAIPMDFLPAELLDGRDIHSEWPWLYWRSGQRILRAARIVADHPGLYPVYIGNFSCGPDSFIQRYFEREIGDKPALHVEIDEHSAAAGVITRLEAFLDAIAVRAARDPVRGPEIERRRIVPLARLAGKTGGRRLVYMPRMSDHSFGVAAAFRACGLEARVMPEPSRDTVALAQRHTSGKECYPLTVTTGDMLAIASSPGFDPDKVAFFMPGGSGPCRFGQYNILQRLLLEKAGLPEAPIFSPMQNENLYRDLALAGSDFPRRSWLGIVVFDLLTKALHRARPFEREAGAADAVYAEHLRLLENQMEARGGEEQLRTTLGRARRDFESLCNGGGGRPGEHLRERPLIGIVGEIFVRSNRFCNEDLVRRVENLGGRAWLSPVDEWIFYVNHLGLEDARRAGNLRRLTQVWLTRRVQTGIVHYLEEPFRGFLDAIGEPPTKHLLAKAKPYLPESVRGEAVLSIGKALDMVERGAAGIINAMPFGCMPGTIVTGLLRRILGDMGAPFISIAFDGAPSPAMTLQLETFMEQVRSRMGQGAT